MSLIEKYKGEKRWVQWKLETVKGKLTKVPYMASGKHASSTDPATWVTYDNTEGDKVGIVLHDKLLVCIDIDHVIENHKIVGEQKEAIADLILEASTYTEISQSGTGLHLFIALTAPLTLTKNKIAPFEVYNDGRYIAVTGNNYGEACEVRTVTPEEALALIEPLIPQAVVNETFPTDDFLPPTTPATVVTLSDADVLAKMFESKNGERIESLYNGNLSGHKNDSSSGDSALCNHLAFWSGKDAGQIERLWMASPLGKREKTQTRKDYRDRTIKDAIKKCKEVYTPPQAEQLDLLFTMKEDKKIYVNNTENICRILRGHSEFAGRLRYDLFQNTLEIKDKGVWRGQEDHDAIDIQTRISVLFPSFMRISKSIVWDAMIKVTKENTVDTAMDYMRALTWDKEARVDQWLMKTYGVEDNEYHRTVGSNWLKALAKRIMVPGCKFDHVLVLEGPQGAKKSTSLGILGGPWHVETSAGTDNKDFFMLFAGKVIIEFSEGETLTRTDHTRMKAIITTVVDRYRMPYERSTKDFPRRSVFAMTTNKEEYLKDDTGNRRWLPVKLVFEKADIEWLANNREQLLAEAYHRVMVGKETLHEFPEDEMTKAQQERMVHDPNEDVVAEWYHNELKILERESGITINQVYVQCLNKGFTPKPMDRGTETQIGNMLTHVFGMQKRKVSVGGARISKYFPAKMSTPTELEAILAVEKDQLF